MENCKIYAVQIESMNKAAPRPEGLVFFVNALFFGDL
jgi:hypothetical protein